MKIYTLVQAERANTNNTELTELMQYISELSSLQSEINLSMGALAKLIKAASADGITQLDDGTTYQLGCVFEMLSDISFLCGDFCETINNDVKEYTL